MRLHFPDLLNVANSGPYPFYEAEPVSRRVDGSRWRRSGKGVLAWPGTSSSPLRPCAD
jgi:hypothetical protein